jgi:hypothetical protein
MAKLLFVDTNIYLDFYRMQNEISLEFLRKLNTVRTSLIVTSQVEMEFKKNRQAAILETLRNLQAPKRIPRVGILSEDVKFKSLKAVCKDMEKGVQELRSKLQQILQEPTAYDQVYKTLEQIFSKSDELSLTEGSSEQKQIVESAHHRFTLGYPPRKKGDSSIGDAINWEWIIYLARLKKADVYLVSRDGDFGVELEQKYYLNDFLKDEFTRRVDEAVTIYFTGKLSDALKKFEVPVSQPQERAEVALMTRTRSVRAAKRLGSYIQYLNTLNEQALQHEVDSRIADTHYRLIDDELICSLMAETNACDWYLDDYEILNIEVEDESATVSISFHATGESDLDRPYCGDEISGTAQAQIDEFGDVSYTKVEADVVDWGPDT